MTLCPGRNIEKEKKRRKEKTWTVGGMCFGKYCRYARYAQRHLSIIHGQEIQSVV